MATWHEFPLPVGIRCRSMEPWRFEVRSESRPNIWHLVDLEEFGFNGACGCERFQFVELPKLRRDREEARPQRTRRCTHILRALIFKGELDTRIEVRHKLQREQNAPT